MADAPSPVEAPPEPRAVPRVVVPRWIQLVLLPLALVAAWGILRAAGNVLLLFVMAALIALLLNPSVALMRRVGLPRGLAVTTVLVAVVGVIAAAGVLLANPVADQVSAVRDAVPDLIDAANDSLAEVQTFLDDNGIGLEVKQQGQTALQTLGDRLLEGSGELVAFTQDALKLLVEASIALILVLVLAIYMLLYGERIGTLVRSLVPRGDGTPQDDYPTRVQSAVFGYVRGQLTFSLIMGTSAGIVLWILGSVGIFPDGRTYALFFGIFYGMAELIPYVGPAIGAAPPVLIALFQNPLDAVWLVIAFTALQQIEGHIVAPQVFGRSLQLNPLLVIAALLLGGQLYGIAGAFIALPIAAVVRETVVYLGRHLTLEPWAVVAGAPAPLLGLALDAAPPPPLPEEAVARPGAEPGMQPSGAPEPAGAEPVCSECGAAVLDATTCPACGTELGGPDAATAAASAGPA